jgi:ABC-type nitrate/sulfonate/bicarbonate transport system permease component
MKVKKLIIKYWFILALLLIMLVIEFIRFDAIWINLIVPKPSAVIISLIEKLVWGKPSIWNDVFITLYRILAGLFIGTIIGAPLGIISGSFGKNVFGIKQLTDFFRSIPQIALFPLLAVAFGIDNFGKIVMVSISVFFIVFVASIEGVIYGIKEREEALKIMGANKKEQFWSLTFPQSLPSIITGIRIASSIAVIVVIVTEMLYGTLDGVGYKLYLSQLSFLAVDMWTYILILGFIGISLNYLISYFSKKIIFWDRLE